MTDSTDYNMAPGRNMGGGLMTGAVAGGPMPQSMTNNGALARVDRVRNVFPETWLWSNTTTGYIKWCSSLSRVCEGSGKWNHFLSHFKHHV